MTYEEAIERLRNRYFTVSMCIDANDAIKENMAIDMAIEALEKQIPMKPIFKELDYYCPTCGKYVEQGRRCAKIACGQAIDWSEE